MEILIKKKMKAFLLMLWVFIIPAACNNVAICERSSYVIKCPDKSLIQIQNASYGRFNNETCPANKTENLHPCISKNVTQLVQNLCHGNNSCLVESNNNVFGPDQCPYTWKYTIIDYICYLESSFIVSEMDTYTKTTLNAFYDELVVSFVILSNGSSTQSIIAISKEEESIMDFSIEIIELSILKMSILNCYYEMQITANTWSSIVISQYFMYNTYNITVAVNGTVQFSDNNAQPMAFTNVFLYTFVDCSYRPDVCQDGSIKNLSIYSKTQVIWTQWTEWSQCNTSFVITRTRSCMNNQFLSCIGNSTEVESCSNSYQVNIEQQTTYVGGIYSIETMDPQYSIAHAPGFGDQARVVQNSAERFFCVEALNGMNDSVSFQSATVVDKKYGYLRTEGRLRIQSPIPRSMCTTYSIYQECTSFIVVDNKFFPGYVSFLKKHFGGVENQLLRNDNNTFIYLQPIQDNDLYKREASFKLVKLGVCNYTTWGNWSDCSATCHHGDCGNPVKIRKRTCQAGTLGGDVYDFQNCNYHVPCPGHLTEWNSWEACSASCKSLVNGPYQYRNRSCVEFFSFDKYYIGCFNSSLNDQQLCNQNVSCPVIWTQWSEWSQCNAFFVIIRTRNCSSNELNCIGNSTEVESCSNSYQEFFLIEKETLLSRNTLVTTLVKHTKEYTISFDLKPTECISNWTNVIHFTTNVDNNEYGNRIPALFFQPNITILRVYSAVNGDKNYLKNTVPLVLGNWSSIKIAQVCVAGKYMYSIEINGENVFQIENKDSRDFFNVKVYASNPWSRAQPGYIKNFKIIQVNNKFNDTWTQWNHWSSCNVSYGNGFMERTRICNVSNKICCGDNYELKKCFTSFYLENETQLVKGKLVETINRLLKEYTVSLEVKLTGVYPNNVTLNLFHLSTNDNYGAYGTRTPAMWIRNGAYYICSAVNSNDEYCINVKIFEPGYWNSFKISQQLIEGKYMYSIEHNCTIIISKENNDSREFTNVKVYVSDPWYDAQPGLIRNLKIKNGKPVIWSPWSIWSTCNYTNGFMNRSRYCNVLNPTDWCDCSNFDLAECDVFWSQWSDWTSCNVTHGFTNRTRKCNTSSAIHGCYGNSSEVKECFAFWSQWSNWTSCNGTYGLINQTRACNISNSLNQCYGNNSEVKDCFVFWEQWSNWTGCNEFNRFMSRSRNCKRLNTAEICFGNSSEVMECPAYWSEWSSWTTCNASHGFVNRTRECKISNSRNWCHVNNSGIIECFALWARWSNLISCGSSNGLPNDTIVINKFRHCQYSNIIDWCHGNNVDVMEYFDKWTTWSECSVTCGLGNRSRYSQHEKIKVIKVENCYQINCPVDGMWGNWSRSECSSTCGNGFKLVNRSCDKPPPSKNGRDCIGVSNYTEVCDTDIICPINGIWSMWSSWSLCSQPCGGGLQSQFRSCSNPVPSFGGRYCSGSSEEFANCSMQNCKSVMLNLKLNFIDEKFEWYSMLTSAEYSTLRDKIQVAISKLYSKINFYVVIHSIENWP